MVLGRKSERYIPEDKAQLQLDLEGVAVEEVETNTEEIKYLRKKQPKEGKAKRLILPADLPRQPETLEPDGLAEGSKKIGEQITEVLEYTAGKLHVCQIIRPKYLLAEKKQDSSQILIADLPSDIPIAQSNASASLLSHLLISKYVDHLPFYRQVQQFKRQGVKIAESIINGWFKKSCQLLQSLYATWQRVASQRLLTNR